MKKKDKWRPVPGIPLKGGLASVKMKVANTSSLLQAQVEEIYVTTLDIYVIKVMYR